jgi:hypothetical protein
VSSQLCTSKIGPASCDTVQVDTLSTHCHCTRRDCSACRRPSSCSSPSVPTNAVVTTQTAELAAAAATATQDRPLLTGTTPLVSLWRHKRKTNKARPCYQPSRAVVSLDNVWQGSSAHTHHKGKQVGPLRSGAYQGGPLRSGAYQGGPLRSGAYQGGPLGPARVDMRLCCKPWTTLVKLTS